MKLLFDQNLSYRLCGALSDVFPDSSQLTRLKLDSAGDDVIWQFARREGYAVVTLDADFSEIAVLRGAPPKVIWLRCGNQPTQVVERLLRDHADAITSFLADPDSSCLEVY